MSSIRQSELFAGQDWQVLYRAFTQVNFNASDPPSINKALRQFIQTYYPESFNDWIESSEFVAILDLLSWLAGTLAFKTDINARENFLETAESRESILRLARFLSYNPQRNFAARGTLKLIEIATDDDVFDSFGNNLSNTTIIWNNPDDPDWYEKFILVLNSSFVQNNRFGTPLKTGLVSGVATQLYRFNNRFGDNSFAFDATIGGDAMSFGLINTDFDDGKGYYERPPNLDAAFHCLYRNDGKGNSSANTGFFIPFKQGVLQNQTFVINTPIENQLIDISTQGINQSDVWVQTVNDQGVVITDWTRVPASIPDNITFNNIPLSNRDIYSVVTRDNDQITLRFSDGRFGNAPVGNIRAWYRTSNGLQYQIRPTDMNRVVMSMRYYNRSGVLHNLTMVFALQESVTNSTPRETEAQIAKRAPQVYATQNRMVSGEDYNTYPLQGNLAVKIKAVNRVYSGHSRYIDLNDPTGTYQDTSVFSDDGIFYKERYDAYSEVPNSLNRTPAEVVGLNIQPALASQETFNYITDLMLTEGLNSVTDPNGLMIVPRGLTWTQVTEAYYSSTGRFSGSYNQLQPGATLLMEKAGVQKWVNIVEINGLVTDQNFPGEPGPVVLSEPLESDYVLVAIVPRFASTLTDAASTSIQDKITKNQSFSIWYNYNADNTDAVAWDIRTADKINLPPYTDKTTVKLLTADYIAGNTWRISAIGIRYVFESEKNVQWYYGGTRTVDSLTGVRKQDYIRVLKVNEDFNNVDDQGVSMGRGFAHDYDLAIDKMIVYPDGYEDPTRVAVNFFDSDENGYPDYPDTFVKVVSPKLNEQILFWQRDSDGTYMPYFDMYAYETENLRAAAIIPTNSYAYQHVSNTNTLYNGTFWQKSETGWDRVYSGFKWAVGRGPNIAKQWRFVGGTDVVPTGSRVDFHWKHFAPADFRIDPSTTNIIDMFVLTSEYDYITRQWIANGAIMEDMPTPPTELDLRNTFSDFEQYKMFSDQIVWRPVRYKFLFGNGADDALKGQFKVVKLPSATLSDGEIKIRVINAIKTYFNIQYWDFGETFYFTELAAYVHNQLASVIGSIVIVPLAEDSAFGDGFEVKCRSDEVFLSTAQVNDVIIIESNTPNNLRIR